MKKALAIFVALALFTPMVSCNSSTIVSCNYDINFVQYTDKPDFVEMMKGNIPLVPMELPPVGAFNTYTREEVLASDSLITIKLNRKPKEVALREYWLNSNNLFDTVVLHSTTGSYAIENKKVLMPMIYRIAYIASSQSYSNIYKGFEMTITFKDDTVEKYAFITKSDF